MLRRSSIPWFLVAMVLCPACVLAENWPGWRGLRGDGTSRETNIPVRWNGPTGEGVLWKVPLPGEGHASPSVWENRVFLVTCQTESLSRDLLCLDRDSGRLLWRKTVVTSPLETKHSLNSHASSTPAIDSDCVYCSFLEADGRKVPATNVGTARDVSTGQMVVAAYSHDGEQKWIARPGGFVSVHGFCSPPVLEGNLVLVNGDHDGDSYVVALDRETGATVWKRDRPHKTRSFCTPIVRDMAGRRQMIFSGNRSIVSLDPKTGETIWNMEGPTEQFVASMVDDGQAVFMTAGFPDYHVMAIRPDGTGNISKSQVKWHVQNAKCYVPSPVVAGPFLFVADDRGTANCFSTETGERYWQERLGTHYSASLATAGGLVYFLADDGLMKVVRPGKSLEVVAENPLGETTYASPALSQGRVFLRSEKHLWCLGTK
jgi:hypothetical protein